MATTVNKTFGADSIVATAPATEPTRRTIYSAPWNVTTDFINALKSQKHVPIALVQTLDRYLTPTADITDDIEDGSVTVDISRMTRRTFQLRVLNEGGKYTPSDVSDPFYFNNYIRIHRGLRYYASDGVETDEYVCIGTFMVDKPEVFVERNMSLLTVDGSDRFKLVASGGFTEDVSFAPGTLVSAIIANALLDAGVPQKSLRVSALEDRPDSLPAGSELIANGTFETNLTGWSSPVSPTVTRSYPMADGTVWTVTYPMYSGSNATLARVAAFDNAPSGSSWVMNVSPNGLCSSAYYGVSGTFLAGQTYTLSGYWHKGSATDPAPTLAAVLGGTNYLGFDSASTVSTIFSAEDVEGWPADYLNWIKPDFGPWAYFTLQWSPLANTNSCSIYFWTEGRYVRSGGTWTRTAPPSYYLDNVSLKGGALGSDRRILKEMSWKQGGSRSEFLSNLLTQFNLRGYFDVYGYFVVEDATDTTTSPPVWTFTAGEDSLMLGVTRIQDDLKLINHVVVVGSDATTTDKVYYGEAQITDTNNPAHKSRIGDRFVKYTGSQITSNGAAQALADRTLRENCRVSESIKVPTLVIPFLEGGDIIQITEPFSGLDSKYEAQRFDIPLRSSRMTIDSKNAEAVV